MKFVEWSRIFDLNHPKIDEEHKELLDIANRFYEHIEKGADVKTIRDTLNNLTKYAQDHFETEEKIMKTMLYPDVKAHAEIHVELLTDVFELNAKFEKGDIHSKEDIGSFLTKWLVQHILNEDKKFYEFRRKMKQTRGRVINID